MTRSPGLSRQSAHAQARDCQGGGLFPLDPPPPAAGGQIAIADQAETDQAESRPKQRDANWNIGRMGIGLMHRSPKPCSRLPGRVEGDCSRCAVRMTAKGSVTPGMACGSRPVERTPELGAFPTVGLRPAAGLLRTAASVLNPPPPTAGWPIAPADGAEPDQAESRLESRVLSRNIPLPWQQAAKNEKQQPAAGDG